MTDSIESVKQAHVMFIMTHSIESIEFTGVAGTKGAFYRHFTGEIRNKHATKESI